MTNLAQPSDVEARLGRDLTDVEAIRVDALLADASAAVRAATGEQFVRATSTTRARIRDGQVRLPLSPVHAVTVVRWPNNEDVGWWFWDGLDIVTLWQNQGGLPSISATPYLRAIYRVVDITYNHGYDVIPPLVVGVTANAVKRSLGIKPGQEYFTGESVEGYSYSRRGDQGAAGAFELLPEELAALGAAGSSTDKFGIIPITQSL